MSTLICDIVTPASLLYSEEAYMVVVPGADGEMGFLENHEPLVSILSEGCARIQPQKDSEMKSFVIQGGYVEVTGKKVIILADRALATSDINEAEVREKLSSLETKRADISSEELEKTTISRDITWYKSQLRALEK